jgi:hypothetical protein
MLVLLVLAEGVLVLGLILILMLMLLMMLMLNWHGGVVVHDWCRAARVVVRRI